jgi:membrane protease YdiL (CAAX protease family)
MKKGGVFLFIIITYLITWAIEIPAAFSTHGLANFKIPKSLQTVSTLTPGIVAILLTAIFEGTNSLKLLLKQLLKWKVSFKWYAFVLVIGALVSGFSLLMFLLITRQKIQLEPAYSLFFFMLIFLFFSPFWEEIGWRGYLLPRMLKRFSPLQASLIIGFIWGLWHLPIYFAINPYGDKTIIFFLFVFLGCFPISILQTWLYNSTKGSLLLCILFHDAINAGASYFYLNLPNKEIRPFEISVAFLTCIAIGVYVKTKGTLSNVH